MIKITIPREKWLRGEVSWRKLWDGRLQNISSLLNKDGMQCCVGHMLRQLGVPNDSLFEKSTAAAIYSLPPTARWLIGPNGNSSDALDLYRLNDSTETSDEEKEKRIIEIAAQHGLDVEFV